MEKEIEQKRVFHTKVVFSHSFGDLEDQLERFTTKITDSIGRNIGFKILSSMYNATLQPDGQMLLSVVIIYEVDI